MTFEDLRKDIYAANFTAGRAYHGWPNFLSDTNVDPATIQARIEFRESAGSPVLISAATSGGGSADGTITISLLGTSGSRFVYQAAIYFSDTVTQTKLADIATEADVRGMRGWGDLKVWAPSVDAGAAQDCGLWQFRVDPEYTA